MSFNDNLFAFWTKYGKKIVYLGLILFVLGYIYFHPNSEQLSCGNDFKCTVEHKYFNCLTFKNQFNVSSQSYLTGNLAFRSANRGLSSRKYIYTVNPQILDSNNKLVKPFIYYYEGYEHGISESKKDVEEILGSEIQEFNEYKKNPNQGFYMEAQSGDIFLIFVIGFTLFAFFMYYVFNFIESGIKKLWALIKK